MSKDETNNQRLLLTGTQEQSQPDYSSRDLHYYETLRSNIVSTAYNAQSTLKKVALTSRYNGEGVTTVASNLALAYAALSNEPVLFLDTNYLNPNSAHIFDIELKPGLGKILKVDKVTRDCIKETQVRNLFVISSADMDIPPCDYPNMPHVLTRLEQHFKHIIIDLPSFERSTISVLNIAKLVDGIIYVIESEKVRWEVAQSTKNQLEKAGSNLLGVVLNKKKYYIPKWLYKTL
jgi:capsular exopolysaccharide synthesis family protein